MRDFEMDFDFDCSEEGLRNLGMKSFRKDGYPAMKLDSFVVRAVDVKRQARIQAHQKRIQAHQKRIQEGLKGID